AQAWTVAVSDLPNLTVAPPTNYTGTMALTVVAVDTNAGNSASSAAQTLNVAVTPVAAAPTLQTPPAIGNENSAIGLNITSAVPSTDPNGVLTVTVTGV